MAWTGIATDLTLEGVVDASDEATRAPKPAAVRYGPPPPVVGGPLPEKPWMFGRVVVVLGLLALAGFVALLVASPSTTREPDVTPVHQVTAPKAVGDPKKNKASAASSPNKGHPPIKSSKPGTPQAADERATDAPVDGELSIEKFRQLSGKI